MCLLLLLLLLLLVLVALERNEYVKERKQNGLEKRGKNPKGNAIHSVPVPRFVRL